jgi:hypothetical protein
MLRLERNGGPCPLCGVLFEAVRSEYVVNWGKKGEITFGGFTYYRPACGCYRICTTVPFPHGSVEGCGRILVAETLLNIPHCTACYPGDAPQKHARRRSTPGRKTATVDGKAAAAGESKDESREASLTL